MSRRIEVELTSARDDGTWTWRAAGARQPKGELDGSLLPAGVAVGDVLRAEADFDLEGITITAVLPPKGARPEPERIEIIGPPPKPRPDPADRPGDRSGRAERRERRPRDRRDGDRRPRGDWPRGERRGGDRPGGDRAGPGPEHGRDRQRDRRPRGERSGRPERPRPGPLPEPRPKPKRLRPGRAHRQALLAGLEPAEAAVAEQLMRGDLRAVRKAVEQQNAEARAAGQPELPLAPVINMAEQLLPRVRAAEWLDRAEAALADVEEISVRDLRSVVVSAEDAARGERSRELADQLRAALDRRAAAATEEWVSDVTAALDAGRVVRALRLSSRPPVPGTSLPPELAARLTEAASSALAADVAPDRWGTVLDAVAYAPVRRDVKPAGVPAEPTDELRDLARKHATRVPAAAEALGVEPPPLRPAGRPAGATSPPAAPAPPSRSGPKEQAPPPPPEPERPAEPEPATAPRPEPERVEGAPPQEAPAPEPEPERVEAPPPPADVQDGAGGRAEARPG